MKKLTILITTICILIHFNSFSQRAYTSPAAFQSSEEVTIFVSVLGTPLEDNAGPIFIWLGANGNSPANPVECTKQVDNLWKFVVTPSPDSYFGVTVTSITGLLKDQGETIETGEFTITPFDFSTLTNMLTVQPATPYYSEPVSLIFDATKSDRDDLTDVSPIYMWAWNNTDNLGDAVNQGQWGSINAEKTVLTQVNGNIWRKDLIPQEYWETTKSITDFGCLFRNFAGDKQTNDQTITLFKAPGLTEKPKKVRVFPSMFTKNDVITIYYDQKLEENVDLKNTSDIYFEASVKKGTGNHLYLQPDTTDADCMITSDDWTSFSGLNEVKRLKFTLTTDSIYIIQFVPQKFFGYYKTLYPAFIFDTMYLTLRNLAGTAKSEEEEISVLSED